MAYPKNVLTEALLAGFRKRIYPDYLYRRNTQIWTTRDEYLEYEAALEIAATVDEIIEPDAKSGSKRTKTPAVAHQFITPATPGLGGPRGITTPLRTPSVRSSRTPISTVKKEEDATEGMDEVGDIEAPESVQVQRARAAKKILDEIVYPKWKELVAAAPGRVKRPGLEHFESGGYE